MRWPLIAGVVGGVVGATGHLGLAPQTKAATTVRVEDEELLTLQRDTGFVFF